jgi:ATPase subunit of ABC transporter with duplicated ATPase domains
MLLIEAKKINKWIGARHLLKNISFNIYKGNKIGFVGRNVTGKSTLLKIIMDQENGYQGQVKLNISIGYLPQFFQYREEQTVEEFFTEVSYDYGRFLRLMREFGFEKDFLDRHIINCSGGEQTKLQLIRLLIEEPELLILDEPTNHLDIKTRDWLAEFLDNFQGGVLLVSHDRYFLDQVVEEVWELQHSELTEYTGDYSEYKKQKKIEIKKKREEYEKYQKQKKRLKASIQKQQQRANRADRGRKRTDSFWRVLKGSDSRTGRMAKRVKSLKSQLEQLDKKEKPVKVKKINPEFKQNISHSEILIRGKNVSKNFNSISVFKKINFSITRNSKIALLGENGIGKTVLLKLLIGKYKVTDGELIHSKVLNLGYFSQKLKELNHDHTILKEVKDKNYNISEEVIRTYLGSMLFNGDDVFKKISNLSLGERVRVAFTNLLLGNSNLLVLDEPLNHLDIISRERIEEALKNYPGAFLLVTHDRYFVKRTANEIWELTNKGLDCFKGSYEEFKKYRNGEYKDHNKIKNQLIKMKRAELIARLVETQDEDEINTIEKKLDNL